MRHKIVYVFIIFLLSFNLYAERWVGHAATYQLMEGSTTASGEIFSPENLAAACNAFKIGAEIKIINANNGKSINVVINDRIKNNSGYFLLLTPKAAKELEMEWQPGIVIIEGKFSDINSNEILDIEGLVTQKEIDRELIKEFPLINWPDTEDKDLKKSTKEDYQIPKQEKDKVPDKKEIKSTKESDINEVDKIENPKKDDTNKIPDKKEKKINENNEVSLKKEKDSIPVEDTTTKIPKEKDKVISTDEEKTSPLKEKENYPNKKEKGLSDDIEDSNIPLKEKEKYPNKKEKGLSDDIEDSNIPLKEKEKYPNKKEKGLSDDIEDSNIPLKEKEKYPNKKEKGLSDDIEDSNIPLKEKEKYPNKKEKGLSDDIEDSNIPLKEKEKYPNKKEKGLSDDIEDSNIPLKEKEKYPNKKEKGLSDDIEEKKSPKKDYFKMPLNKEKKFAKDTEVEEKKIEQRKEEKIIEKEVVWQTSLEKGKIYIRLITLFDKKEGEKNYRVFKEVFSDLIGLKDGNKYILVIGPYSVDRVNDTLVKVRKFGFKDAYIVKYPENF